MKFVMELNGNKLLLESAQLEAIVNALNGAEYLESKYIGNKLGANGSNYIDLISPLVLRDATKVSMMSEEEYGAMKFITQQHLQAERDKK